MDKVLYPEHPHFAFEDTSSMTTSEGKKKGLSFGINIQSKLNVKVSAANCSTIAPASSRCFILLYSLSH